MKDKKQLVKNKYYKNAYNNPSQYNFNKLVDVLENATDEKLIKAISMQITGLRDAENDKKENVYKYIL